MRLEKWNPFRDLDDIFHNYQRSFLTPSMGRESMVGSEWVPAVDIVEDDKEYQLKVEIPEIPRDAVKLQINHGMLTITGEIENTTDEIKDVVKRLVPTTEHIQVEVETPEAK